MMPNSTNSGQCQALPPARPSRERSSCHASKPSFMKSMPRNSRPMPSRTPAAAARPSLSAREPSSPRARKGMANWARSKRRPKPAISQAPVVVPRLAPNSRAMAPGSATRPAPTKESESRVTRELDCTSAVAMAPTPMARRGWRVAAWSQRSRVPPERRLMASLRWVMPHRKSPSPAARVARSMRASSRAAAAASPSASRWWRRDSSACATPWRVISVTLGVEDLYRLEVLLAPVVARLVDANSQLGERLLLDGQLLEEVAADALTIADAVLLPAADAIHLGTARADGAGDKAFLDGHDGSCRAPAC